MNSSNLARLGNFIEKVSIKAATLKNYEKLQILGVSNTEGITVTSHGMSEDTSKYQFIDEYCFTYNPYRINVGSIGLTSKGERGLVSPAYVVFRTKPKKLVPEMLLDYLKSEEGLFQVNKFARGTVRKALRYDDLSKIEVPNIPFEQQLAGQQKKETIKSSLLPLKIEITHQQSILKKLRQSILLDAISGKLTEKWRKENPDVEPAIELLARIKAEKERLVKEKKIKKQKPLLPITENEIPFDLPEGWGWYRLGDLIYEDPRNGYSPKTVDFVTKVKTLKLGATTTGKFIDSEIKFVNENIESDSFLWLKHGDILIQRSNSIDHVGVSAIFCGPVGEFIYPDLMMKIQPYNEIDVTFLHNVLLSPFVRNYFRSNASGTQKSMPKINQATVAKTLIPLPPKQEVTIILSKLKSIFTCCSELEQQINKSQQDSVLLMQAVFREAFGN